MENQTQNPWLGLKSYSEGRILYGRDKEIEELSQKVLYNTQTVIYGKSGIGKSSLLKAGVFPILRRNGYFPVYVRFVHEKGEASYTCQIINAVDEALKRLKVEDLGAPDGDVYKKVEGYQEEIVPVYRKDKEESMWEYFHRFKFYYKLNEEDEPHEIIPVLIFDQFEEIFTLQKEESRVKGFFEEFAALLNNICPDYLLQPTVEAESEQPQSSGSTLIKRGVVKTAKRWDYIDETNLHVVLSLREDFLSYLERNIVHIPSLKHNRYCLLPLNEDQAAEVIMQPVPGLISVKVAKEIICKVTGASSNDFEIDDTPELEVDSAILSLFLSELYEKKGDASVISYEMVEQLGSNIISEFYEKTVNNREKISESSVCYLERRLVTKEERRDSIFDEQAMRHGVTQDELNYLYDCRLLHHYPWREGTRIEYSHDVLCPIVIGRRKRRDEELEKKKQEEALIKLRKEKRRYRLALMLTFFSLLAVGLFIYDGWFDVKVERYAKIIKKNTWIKGVKPLSKEEASYLSNHYVFYKTGRYARYDSIEARNGYGELTADHSMSTYLVNQFDDTDNKADQQMVERLKSVVKWVMVPDNADKYCLQEKAYDKDGALVFSFNNSITDNDSVFISTYVDEYGFPIVMRDSCYIYLRTTMNKEGYQVLQEFFDDKGFPVMNKDHAFQTERSYFPNGIQKGETSRFLNGHRMIDRFGNCGWEILELDENGYDEKLAVYFDANRELCRVNDGVMFRRYEYDEYGRQIKETYWKIEDTSIKVNLIKPLMELGMLELLPDTNRYGVHAYVSEYNRHGKNTRFYTIGIESSPVKASNRDFVELRREYDDKGNMISEIGIDESGKINWEFMAKYTEDGEMVFDKRYYIDEDGDTLMDRHVYWNKKINRKIQKDYFYDSGHYDYREYDSEGRELMVAYYEIGTDKPLADSDGLHKTVTEYQYDPENRRLTQIEQYFDINGYICGWRGKGSFSKKVTETDSLSHTQSIIRYTTKGVYSEGVERDECPNEIFYTGEENLFNDKFTVSLGMTSLDAYGMKRRTYENSAYFYQVRHINSILPSHANESKGFYAMNEFGEPSLIRYNATLYSAIFDGRRFDEYGHEISEEGLDDRFMFAAIETNVNMGFMDGDILIQQDDWLLWTNGDFNELDLEPQPDRDHYFRVLRFNELQKEYDIVEIEIPAGDERVTQIEYNKYYVTDVEKERVFNVMRKKVYPRMFEFVPSEEGAIYEQGMKREAMVLAINDWDMTQHFGGAQDSLIEFLQRKKGEVKHIMVYDEEAEEVQTYVVDADTLGVNIKSYSVKPDYYNQMLQEMKKAKNQRKFSE